MVIMLVLAQVLGQIADALRQKGNLHFGGAYITGVGLKVVDDLRFLLFGYGHTFLQQKLTIGAP